MLKFNGAWRFDNPGPIADGVLLDFSRLIGKIATQGDRQTILEHFKTYFADAAGTTSSLTKVECVNSSLLCAAISVGRAIFSGQQNAAEPSRVRKA
jgi:hypothetical protein